MAEEFLFEEYPSQIMLVELQEGKHELVMSHAKFIHDKVNEEVRYRGEKSLKTERGLRLALRNLKKVIDEETKGEKEFLGYIRPPNGKGEYETLFYTRMRLKLAQGFWVEDTLDEKRQNWRPDLLLGSETEDTNTHLIQFVAYTQEIPMDDEDMYLTLRMLLEVKS